MFFSPPLLSCDLSLESNKTFSHCHPCLANFAHLFFCCSCSWANLRSKRWQFSPHHVLVGSKSKPDQNKINWLGSASDVSPTPALIQSAFHLASLPFPSPPNRTYSHRYLYLHIFIYLLLHSWFSLNNLLHPSLSPLPATALSVNKLKFVCHCGGTARRCPSNLTRFITPLIESDQKPIESQSNICISPSSVWFNCQCRGSRFYCRLPEPRHSSLPRNLVSRFTA